MSKRTRGVLIGAGLAGLALFAIGCAAEEPVAPQPRIVLFSDNPRMLDHWHMILAGARQWEEFGFTVADPIMVAPGALPPNYNATRCKGAWQYRNDCDLHMYMTIVDGLRNAGETDHVNGVIRFAGGLVGTSWMYVAAHEIGHMLGLPHLPRGVVGLMNGDSNFINDNDRALVCEILDICL